MPDFVDAAGELLGPLTESWSIPESCTRLFVACSTCEEAWRGQKCTSVNGNSRTDDNADCWPPTSSVGVRSPDPPFIGWGYYSPGLACPTGYTSACTAVQGQFSEWEIQFKLRPGETAVGCCPQGYTCTNRNGNTCVTVATESTVIPTAMCDGTDMANLGVLTLPDTVMTSARVEDDETIPPGIMTRGVTLMAPMFQLNFQSTDLTDGPTPQETAKDESPAETDAASSSTESDSGDVEQGGGGLSVGAKAGLGVGVSLGVLLIALVGLFMYRRRRPARPEYPADASEVPHTPFDRRETDVQPAAEYYQKQPSEMNQYKDPAELYPGLKPTFVELPTTEYRR